MRVDHQELIEVSISLGFGAGIDRFCVVMRFEFFILNGIDHWIKRDS